METKEEERRRDMKSEDEVEEGIGSDRKRKEEKGRERKI